MATSPVQVTFKVVNRLGEAAGRAMAGFAVAGAPGPNREDRRGGRSTFGSTWADLHRAGSTPSGWGACHGLPRRQP